MFFFSNSMTDPPSSSTTLGQVKTESRVVDERLKIEKGVVILENLFAFMSKDFLC